MKIVYIAHPISGDVERNIQLVKDRCRIIFKHWVGVEPIAPYLFALEFLDDANPESRKRGTALNKEHFDRGMVDELWLFGDRISSGMWEEVCWARGLGVPIRAMTKETEIELIRREINIGDTVQIRGCGPSVRTEGTFFGEHEHGVWMWVAGRLHELYWGDITELAPLGVPL